MNRIMQLAVNPEGFVFDPAFGEVFTVNTAGLTILDGLRQNKHTRLIAGELAEAFEISQEEAEKDIFDFIHHLRTYRLIDQDPSTSKAS